MEIKKYIVHLADHVQRKLDFLSVNTVPNNFIWMEGTIGANVNRQALVQSGVLKKEAEIIDGSLGNALSFIRLFKQSIDTNEIVTILENDAILSHHFDPYSLRLLESIGFDFDIIQWGWNFDSVLYLFPLSSAMGPVEIRARQDFAQTGFRKFQELACARTLIPLGHQWGAHCFTVTPKGAKRLLEMLLPLNTDLFFREDLNLRIKPRSLDSMLGRCYPKLKAYSCFPPLSMALNDKAKSTIWIGSANVSHRTGFKRLRHRIKNTFSRVFGFRHTP
jgi:glycosyl transferase, family 25